MDDRTRPLAGHERPSRHLVTGEVVGAWRVGRALAAGGFGAVYTAAHVHTHAPAALKLLHAHLVTSAETLARFDREIRVIGALQHPNVVRLVDAGFASDGRPYLCMELLDGEDLDTRIAREGKLAPAAALEVFAHVCEALAAAHARGIVHRDVKSSNVMVCSDGRVVLLDFGIAKISDALAPELTATNQALGTPSCMAPEQIRGAPADARTDVYALGALLFQLLTARMPFTDPSPTMTQYLHLHARRPRPSQAAPGLSERFDDVIARAMAVEPAERFADPRLLLAAAFAASRETKAVPAVAFRPALAVLVAVAVRDGDLDAGLFADLEAVLPAAERLLATRGFAIAIDFGASAVFIGPPVGDPAALAREVFATLDRRAARDPRVRVGLAIHADDAPFIGPEIQPCALLRPATWPVPDTLEGVWISASISGH